MKPRNKRNTTKLKRRKRNVNFLTKRKKFKEGIRTFLLHGLAGLLVIEFLLSQKRKNENP